MAYNRICIVGSGNVAYHLTDLCVRKGKTVVIYSRNKIQALEIAAQFACEVLEKPADLDAHTLVLLCVRDAAIPSCLELFPAHLPVAYTSGSVALQSLAQRPLLGVFYPLQTFSKGTSLREVNFPFLLESNNSDFLLDLQELGQELTGYTVSANSEERAKLHLSAVFANNFANHLWHLSQENLKESSLDWKLLLPLLRESLAKLDYKTAYEAQTGPARRKDQETIAKQENALAGMSKEIYILLTKSISNTYKKDTHD